MSSSSNSNNPKSYYNTPNYDGAASSSSSQHQPKVVYKPDEISSISTSDLLPPPPYSPNPSAATVGRNSSSSYGSVHNNRGSLDLENQQQQQQQPLLSNISPKPAVWVSSSIDPLEQQAQQATPSTSFSPGLALFNKKNRKSLFHAASHNSGDEHDVGHCRVWCKYIFAAILLSLVIYEYSDKLFSGVTPAKPKPSPSLPPQQPNYCSSSNVGDCVTWQGMPSTIDFDSIKNLELIVKHTNDNDQQYSQGQQLHEEGEEDDYYYVIQQGQLIITPTEDRHRGTILSDIKIYPTDLDLSYDLTYPEDDTLRLLVEVPMYFKMRGNERQQRRPCVNAQIEIKLPYDLDNVHVQLTNMNIDVVGPFVTDNMEVLDLQSSNGHIILNEGWAGKRKLNLITSNGNIEINGDKVISDDEVYIETSNGKIRFTQDVIAKRRVQITNSNGEIEALPNLIQADSEVLLKTSNAATKLSRVMADRVITENANGIVSIVHAEAKQEIVVTNSNGPISLSVYGTKNNRVTVITSNAKASLHMPYEFEGAFALSTSFGDVRIESDEGITYQDKLDHLKRGFRRGKGNKGDLTAQTSNADIEVAFDV